MQIKSKPIHKANYKPVDINSLKRHGSHELRIDPKDDNAIYIVDIGDPDLREFFYYRFKVEQVTNKIFDL